MELPISQLKLISHEKIIPDLSKKDFYALKESIEKWGIIEPIVINQHNVIICGKERYRAALLLGIEKVPVVIRKTNGNAEIRSISIEDNLRRRHLASSRKAKGEKPFCELRRVRSKAETERRERKYAGSRGVVTKQLDIPKQHLSRYHISAKLIPELSKLLDERRITQEAALLYATLPFENQKKIYGILMDNFSHDKFMKR